MYLPEIDKQQAWLMLCLSRMKTTLGVLSERMKAESLGRVHHHQAAMIRSDHEQRPGSIGSAYQSSGAAGILADGRGQGSTGSLYQSADFGLANGSSRLTASVSDVHQTHLAFSGQSESYRVSGGRFGVNRIPGYDYELTGQRQACGSFTRQAESHVVCGRHFGQSDAAQDAGLVTREQAHGQRRHRNSTGSQLQTQTQTQTQAQTQAQTQVRSVSSALLSASTSVPSAADPDRTGMQAPSGGVSVIVNANVPPPQNRYLPPPVGHVPKKVSISTDSDSGSFDTRQATASASSSFRKASTVTNPYSDSFGAKQLGTLALSHHNTPEDSDLAVWSNQILTNQSRRTPPLRRGTKAWEMFSHKSYFRKRVSALVHSTW
jgi:hypothetical protein